MNFAIGSKMMHFLVMTILNKEIMKEGLTLYCDPEEKLPKFIMLLDGKTKMRLRQSQKNLRIHASRHKKTNHERVYSEMLLFLPWRKEEQLFPEDEEKCLNHYENEDHYEIIEHNRKKIFPFSKAIEVLHEIANSDNERPAHIYDNLDPEGQQDNLEVEEEMPPLDTSELPDEEPTIPTCKQSKKGAVNKESFITRPIVIGSDQQMYEDARNLSFEQKLVFNIYMDFCQRTKILREGHFIELDAPKLKVTGIFKSNCKRKVIDYMALSIIDCRRRGCWQNLFDAGIKSMGRKTT